MKDIEKNSVFLGRRDTGEKTSIKTDTLIEEIETILQNIQDNIFNKALKNRDENIFSLDTKNNFYDFFKSDKKKAFL